MKPFSTMTEGEAERFMSSKERHRVYAVMARMVGSASVIDLGCGRGIQVGRYTQDQYYGVDASPELIKLARRDNPGYKFDVLGIEDVMPMGHEFGIMKSVLEHQPALEDAIAIYEHSLTLCGTLIVSWHTPPVYDTTTIMRVKAELDEPIFQNHYREGSFEVPGVQVKTSHVDGVTLWTVSS